MRHYYSIANFLAGMGTKIYDNYFSIYGDETYQQLLGQFTAIARGPVGANVAQGILPQNLINQWGNNLAQTIATEWLHCVANMENSPGWNGDARTMIHTSLWNFMSECSTATTIAAAILDFIDNNFNIITPGIELPDTVDYQITNVTIKALDFTSTFSQQSIDNGNNMINFKNAETLLNKYGYQNYTGNPELFLTHLKDGKKLLKDTDVLDMKNPKYIELAYVFTNLSTNLSSLKYEKKDINNCNKLYQIFDKMGYNNMRYVPLQKQFFKALEKNDVLNTMKKMGELSEYTSEYGFYHSKILNLIDDYNSNNNDQCLKINNTFYFEKECEE